MIVHAMIVIAAVVSELFELATVQGSGSSALELVIVAGCFTILNGVITVLLTYLLSRLSKSNEEETTSSQHRNPNDPDISV